MSELTLGFAHPLVDHVEGEYACSETRTDRVILTEALADALVATTGAGLTPVWITRPIARLSYLARYHLTIAGGRWLVRDGQTLRDPLTGVVANTVAQALSGDRPARVLRPAGDVTRYLIALSTQAPADEETILGDAVVSLAERLAHTAPAAWGPHEPATLAWDRTAYTAASKAWMPGPVRWMIADAEGRARFTSTVRRTKGGVEETLTGILAVPSSARADVTAHAVSALVALADEVAAPLFGSISVQSGPADLGYDAQPVDPAIAVAALVGPRATRALAPDLGVLEREFGARTAGRPRTPSIVVGFGRPEGDPLEVATRFAQALGTEQITRLLTRAEGAS